MRIDIASQVLIFDWKKQKANVRFRVTADSSFVAKDNDGSAVVVDAQPSIFREVDVTIADVLINGVTTTQVTVPAMWLFSTNDVLKGKGLARYSCFLVDKQGTLLHTFDGLQNIQIVKELIDLTNPTTWTTIVIFNSPAAPEPINRETFSREQILMLLGSGFPVTVREVDGSPSIFPVTAIEFNQANGFIVTNEGLGVARVGVSVPSALTVREVDGTPSISATVLEFNQANGFVLTDQGSGVMRVGFSGGGGGTTINPTNNVVPFRLDATTFADSSISSGANLATQFAITARNATTSSYAFRFLTPADTALSAGVESPMLQFGGNVGQATVTRQWATGALTTQREHIFFHPTYAFVGASTLTNAATLAITNAPLQGTNATISNAYALWVQAGVTRLGGQVGVNSNPDGAQLHVVTDADATNGFILQGTATANSDLMQVHRGLGLIKFRIGSFGSVEITPSPATSGNPVSLNVLAPASTGMGNTEKSDIVFSLDRTLTFTGGGGAIALQRAFSITSPTYAASAAQTITRAATVYISDAPIAGSNITLTETLALLVEAGNSKFGGRVGVNVPSGTLPGGMIDARSIGDNVVPLSIRGTATQTADLFLVRRGAAGTNFAIDPLGRTFVTPTATTGTAGLAFQVVSPGHSDLSNVEQNLISFDMSPTLNFLGGGGAIAIQRSLFVFAPTFNADAAQTITTAATFVIDKAPVASTNITITNPLAMLVEAGNVRFGTPATNQPELQLTASGNANITSILSGDSPTSSVRYKLPADNPAATEQLTVTSFSGGIAVLEWAAAGGGGGGSPGGADGELQYRVNSTTFGGVAGSVVTTLGEVDHNNTARTSGGSVRYFRVRTPADTALAADTESIGIQFGGNASAATVVRQFTQAAGTFTDQREIVVVAPTYAATAAETITGVAATLAITGAPIAGTNMTLSNARALWVQAGRSQFPAGSVSTPAITFNADGFGNSGIFSEGTNVVFASNGAFVGGFSAGGGGSFKALLLASGSPLGWSASDSSITGASDLSLVRHAAGVLRLQDGLGSDTAGQLLIGAGGDTVGAQLDVRAEATTRTAFRADSSVNSTVVLAQFNANVDDTATVANVFEINTISNGTPAIGFGTSFTMSLEDAGGTLRGASQFSINWRVATGGSASSEFSLGLMEAGAGGEKLRVSSHGQIKYYGLKRQTADVVKTSSTTFSDLTGLTFELVTGRKYKVRFHIECNTTPTTGGGAKITLNGTATASAVLGWAHFLDNQTVGNWVVGSAFRGTLIDGTQTWSFVAAANASGGGSFVGEATIECNGSGNLRIQGAQVTSDADSTTFLTNGTMEVWEISN